MRLRTTLLLGAACLAARTLAEQKQNVKVFVPTHEWQVVEEGQAIPPGLHVRVDFQTGVKEAKLLDESEHSTASNALLVATDDLDRTLDPGALFDKVAHDHKNFRLKYWSADATNKMQRLVEQLTSRTELVQTLEEVEEEVHDLQQAGMFMAAGGLDALLSLVTDDEIDVTSRARAATALGSCVQSNPDAQASALSLGALTALTDLLASASPSHPAGWSAHVGSLVYAYSALLRNSVNAQRPLATDGNGLAVLARVFDEHQWARMRVLTLLTDVIQQQEDQHALVQGMAQGGWCARVLDILHTADNVDASEKVLQAMSALMVGCGDSWAADKMANTRVHDMADQWKREAGEEKDAHWRAYLATLQDLATTVSTALAPRNATRAAPHEYV